SVRDCPLPARGRARRVRRPSAPRRARRCTRPGGREAPARPRRPGARDRASARQSPRGGGASAACDAGGSHGHRRGATRGALRARAGADGRAHGGRAPARRRGPGGGRPRPDPRRHAGGGPAPGGLGHGDARGGAAGPARGARRGRAGGAPRALRGGSGVVSALARVAGPLAPPIAATLVRVLGTTLRLTVAGTEAVGRHWAPGRPVIYAVWHGQVLLVPWINERLRASHGARPATVLVSRSRDGEIVAGYLSRFGLDSVRGSTSQGGREAGRA